MNTKVKICGIKTIGEIEIINKYPVDYIGFIFTKSKRQISLEKANELRGCVRENIKVVGVFMDEDEAFILKAVKAGKLDAVQLHGDYDFSIINKLMQNENIKEVFKTVAVLDKESIKKAIKLKNHVSRILLDTSSGGNTGGTGVCFDWRLIDELKFKHELILAGGLNPENMGDAIERVDPYMVDLNSGLETDLIKDEAKIKKALDAIYRRNKQ